MVGLILDRAELGGQGWGRGGGGGGGRGTAGTSSSRREFLRAIWNVFFIGLEANIIEGVPFNGKGEVRDIFKVFKSY